jgi:hypothetical protein
MNKVLVILGLTTAGLASASGYLYRQLGTERERIQALEQQIESLRAQPVQPRNSATRSFSSTSAEPDDAAASAEKTEIPRDVQLAQSITMRVNSFQTAPSDPTNMRERFVNQQRALMKDPEYRTALLKQQRMMMGRQYPYLAEDLELTPEQTEQLLDLLAEQQIESMQETNAIDPSTLQSDPSAMTQYQQAMEERRKANEAALTEAIGVEGMQRWQDYQRTMGSRFRAVQLSEALRTSGMPLRTDQEKALRLALADHEKQMQQEAESFASQFNTGAGSTLKGRLKIEEEQLERTAKYYERARTSVAGILTPEQLDQYKSIHEQELAMRRAQLRVQRAQLEASGDTEDAPGQFRFGGGSMMGTATGVIVSDQ